MAMEKEPIYLRDWLEVKEETFDLILSGLAAKVAWRPGYGPITFCPWITHWLP